MSLWPAVKQQIEISSSNFLIASLELWSPSFPQASRMQTAASAPLAATQHPTIPPLSSEECLGGGVCMGLVVGIMDPFTVTAGWYQVSHLHLRDISSYLTRSPNVSGPTGGANLTFHSPHLLCFYAFLGGQFSFSLPLTGLSFVFTALLSFLS